MDRRIRKLLAICACSWGLIAPAGAQFESQAEMLAVMRVMVKQEGVPPDFTLLLNCSRPASQVCVDNLWPTIEKAISSQPGVPQKRDLLPMYLISEDRHDILLQVAPRLPASSTLDNPSRIVRSTWLFLGGRVARARRDFLPSLQWLQQAVDLLRPLAQEHCEQFSTALQALAVRQLETYRTLEAGQSFRELHGISQYCFGAAPYQVGVGLIQSLLRQGLTTEAVALAEAEVKRQISFTKSTDRIRFQADQQQVIMRALLGDALILDGNVAKGMELKRAVYEQRKAQLQNSNPMVRAQFVGFASAYVESLMRYGDSGQVPAVLEQARAVADALKFNSIALRHAEIEFNAQYGQASSAIEPLRKSIADTIVSLGADSGDEAILRSVLAVALQRAGAADAKVSADSALEILLKQGWTRGLATAGDVNQRQNVAEAASRLLRVYHAQAAAASDPSAILERAFLAFQVLRAHPAQAISESRIDAYIQDPGGRKAAREWLTLRRAYEKLEINSIDRALEPQSVSSTQPDSLPEIQKAWDAMQAAWQRVEASGTPGLLSQFSRPIGLKDARAALGAEDALLAFHGHGRAAYVWAVTRTGTCFKEMVHRELVMGAGRTIRQAFTSQGRLDEIPTARFPGGAAHRMYVGIAEPCSSLLNGKKRIFYAPGIGVEDIPPAMFLAVAPAEERMRHAELPGASWWLRQAAFSTLAVESSLLGGKSAVKPDRAFIGFADPAPESTERAQDDVLRGMSGVPFDEAALAALKQLPGTPRDLQLLAKVLNADGTFLKIGADATVDAVLKEELRRYRHIAFSTHAILYKPAGQRFPEHALVLPRLSGGKLQNSVLTTGDIERLSIGAEAVYLLACATSAGAGRAHGTHLSGLVRAFGNAGARSVVFSYWPVTNLQTGRFVEHFAKAPLPDAFAVQAASLHLLGFAEKEKTDQLAHPFYWAGMGISAPAR